MSKPIDWVKPLRVVNRHWRAWVEEIDPGASLPVKIRICDDKGNSWIDRVDGRGYSGELVVIENIPPEPRIVEKWMAVRSAVTPASEKHLSIVDVGFFESRKEVEDFSKQYSDNIFIAKVLVEVSQ